ncbi:MAG TPA: hypothetical protein VII02_02095 [Gemmatimonadaceae bacterium]
MKRIVVLILMVLITAAGVGMKQKTGGPSTRTRQASAKPAAASGRVLAQDDRALEIELVAKYGEGQRERVRRGLKQVAQSWRAEDGDKASFEQFARANFASNAAEGGRATDLDQVFARFERLMEQIDGHAQEMGREFRTEADLDLGPMLPMDEVFAGWDPSAHVLDDMFRNKLAFVALLNFPLTTLEQRLTEGRTWTRRQWAEARLAQRFSKRVPAEVNAAIAQASAEADHYVAEYNLWMRHVVGSGSSVVGRQSSAKADAAKVEERLFPPKMRLLSHWNLRDQIKADYDVADGLPRQRVIQQVMERIVTQTIPEAVVNNPQVDWNPWTNEVKPATEKDSDFAPSNAGRGRPAYNGKDREPDTRYAMLLKTYQASRKMDPYSPTAPTLIARRFDENREIPEERVRKMLTDVVSSPLAPKVAALIRKRLGRELEPFDVWYSGFRPKSEYTEAQLDEIVRKKYPTPEAYQKDIPNLLVKLGFAPERVQFVAANIVVDPARGSGHAMGSGMRDAKVHLRTRVEKTGMNYKGFNIAVHEMGHNVEQTFSMKDVDHTLLAGVPNTAFTEALAFVFQARDLELLGLHNPTPQDEAMRTLNEFWGTYEIAGVALVDMGVWHWMYDHPNATPAELREATLGIAKEIWNKYYAPVLGKKDVVLLAVYSHMIDSFLYLPDYPIGHMIAFQIEEQINKAGKVGPEFERVAKFGSVAPDLWMEHATGAPVSPEALLRATEKAIGQVGN